MTAVTCTNVDPKSMTLTWTAVSTTSDGGDAISFYGVELLVSGTTWTQVNSDTSNLYITYTYTSATNFPGSTTYTFRVRAKNGVGYSNVYSGNVNCLSDDIPSGMTTIA